MKQWYALMFAVIAEISSTTMLKFFGDNESVISYSIVFTLIGFSYYLLSKAVTKIPISTAYAVWEGSGLIAITIIGCLIFAEKLSASKLIGFSAILLGIILLKNGTINGEHHE